MMRLWKGKAEQRSATKFGKCELVQEGSVVCGEGSGKGVGAMGGWAGWELEQLDPKQTVEQLREATSGEFQIAEMKGIGMGCG